MMENTKDIYLELYDYIVEKITVEKLDIIGEIKRLKKINIITEDLNKNSKKVLKSTKERKSEEITESSMSKSISRKMTSEEMLFSTLEILRSHVVSIPMLEQRIVELLGQEDDNNIEWVTEDSEEDVVELSQFRCYEREELENILKSMNKIFEEVKSIGSQR